VRQLLPLQDCAAAISRSSCAAAAAARIRSFPEEEAAHHCFRHLYRADLHASASLTLSSSSSLTPSIENMLALHAVELEGSEDYL